jgi:uncharacterized protein YciI
LKYLVTTMRKSQFDERFVPAHYDFLKDLRARGLLEQAGPFTDKSGGAYVITGASAEEAVHIAEQDPLHVNDCSEVTVRQWQSS